MVDDHLARVMPLSVRIQLGADIANGLAHLHENQVLHVDLRPANILLDKVCKFILTFMTML